VLVPDKLAVFTIQHPSIPECIPFPFAVPGSKAIAAQVFGLPDYDLAVKSKSKPNVKICTTSVSMPAAGEDDSHLADLRGTLHPDFSGGPVLTADGELLGVSYIRDDGDHQSKLVPIESLRDLMKGRFGGLEAYRISLQNWLSRGTCRIRSCTTSTIQSSERSICGR
jgi:hypothetical protein